MPGVWLFHIGNTNTFDNVIPAEAPGHLPTTVPKNQAVEFQTTPEYPTEEYDDANDSFDEETEYNIDPDFQNPDATEFPQAGRDASLLSGDVTLSPDHTAQTNVSPDEIDESVHPFPKHTLLVAYPIRPEGEVVTVEENVNVNSEGEAETVETQLCSSYASFCFFLFFILKLITGFGFHVLLKSNSCSSSPSVSPSLLHSFK